MLTTSRNLPLSRKKASLGWHLSKLSVVGHFSKLVPSLSAMFLLLVLLNFYLRVAQTSPEAGRLFEVLLSDYNKLSRPVEDSLEIVHIEFKLKLLQILDVQEKDQIVTTNGWLLHTWTDYRLRWNPIDYDNLTTMHIPSSLIWLPDVILYNNADGTPQVTKMTKAHVRYDGRVKWQPPVTYSSMCAINIEWFPFDIQYCHLKFGAWTYYGSELDMSHQTTDNVTEEIDLNNETVWSVELGVDISDYQDSVEWDLMSAKGTKHSKWYPCCDYPFVDITYYISIRRKTLFYAINLITPCVGITMLTGLVFYLPSDSNNKITLSVSVLVSMTVFFLLLVEIVPPTSTAIPLIARYLLFTMILVTCSLCVTVFVLNIHYRSVLARAMPHWIRRALIERAGPMLAMRRPKRAEMAVFDETRLLPNNMTPFKSTTITSIDRSSPQSKTSLDNSQFSLMKGTINRVCRNVFYIAGHLQKLQCEEEVKEEWRFLAMVIDRIFLIIFTLAILVGSGIIIFSAPSFYDYRAPIA